MSSPATMPIRSWSASPCLAATIRTASAQAWGLTPPALAMTRTFFCQNLRQDAVHQGHEVSGESGLRIPGLLLLHDGHGDFGQIVEHEVVHGAAFDEPHRRFQPVTPEALPASDTNGFHGNNPTFLSGVCHARGMVASWPAGRKHK